MIFVDNNKNTEHHHHNLSHKKQEETEYILYIIMPTSIHTAGVLSVFTSPYHLDIYYWNLIFPEWKISLLTTHTIQTTKKISILFEQQLKWRHADYNRGNPADWWCAILPRIFQISLACQELWHCELCERAEEQNRAADWTQLKGGGRGKRQEESGKIQRTGWRQSNYL